jgi:Ca2+-binding EF-hand superfamily protein
VVSGDAFVILSADTDGDLITSRAELDGVLPTLFAAADADASGALSPLEFQAFAARYMGGELLGPFRLEFDRNVDNTITLEEFTAAFVARFDRYDGDEDATVSRVELVRPLDLGGQPLRERPRAPRQQPPPG